MKLIFCLAHDNLVNSIVLVGYELTSIFLRANKQSLVVDCKNVVICVIQLQKITPVSKVKSHKSNLKSMDIYIYIGWCSLLFNNSVSEISHFDICNQYKIEKSYRRSIFSICKNIANEMNGNKPSTEGIINSHFIHEILSLIAVY